MAKPQGHAFHGRWPNNEMAKSKGRAFHMRWPNHRVTHFTGCFTMRRHFTGCAAGLQKMHGKSAKPQDASLLRGCGHCTGNRPNHKMRRDFTGWASQDAQHTHFTGWGFTRCTGNRPNQRMRAFYGRLAEITGCGHCTGNWPNHRMRLDFTGWAISCAVVSKLESKTDKQTVINNKTNRQTDK